MTIEQRRAELQAIIDAMPGRKVDRIRKICSILHYKENSIRIFLIDPDKPSGTKAMPEAKLRILKRELEREKQDAERAA